MAFTSLILPSLSTMNCTVTVYVPSLAPFSTGTFGSRFLSRYMRHSLSPPLKLASTSTFSKTLFSSSSFFSSTTCLPSSTTAGARPSSFIPSWLTTSIFVSSNSFTSGGISSFFTSSSFTILGGVNFVISTFGGSCFGGGGGGGSGFFSSSCFNSVRVNSLTCTFPAFFFSVLARKEPPSASNATAAVQSKAIVSLFLYVLRSSYAP